MFCVFRADTLGAWRFSRGAGLSWRRPRWTGAGPSFRDCGPLGRQWAHPPGITFRTWLGLLPRTGVERTTTTCRPNRPTRVVLRQANVRLAHANTLVARFAPGIPCPICPVPTCTHRAVSRRVMSQSGLLERYSSATETGRSLDTLPRTSISTPIRVSPATRCSSFPQPRLDL